MRETKQEESIEKEAINDFIAALSEIPKVGGNSSSSAYAVKHLTIEVLVLERLIIHQA